MLFRRLPLPVYLYRRIPKYTLHQLIWDQRLTIHHDNPYKTRLNHDRKKSLILQIMKQMPKKRIFAWLDEHYPVEWMREFQGRGKWGRPRTRWGKVGWKRGRTRIKPKPEIDARVEEWEKIKAGGC